MFNYSLVSPLFVLDDVFMSGACYVQCTRCLAPEFSMMSAKAVTDEFTDISIQLDN